MLNTRSDDDVFDGACISIVLAIYCTAIKRSARSTSPSLLPGKTSRSWPVRASVICAGATNAVYFLPQTNRLGSHIIVDTVSSAFVALVHYLVTQP